jgi:hypothetical protein
MSDLTEDQLRVAVMKADLYLKTRQGWWETPRNLALIIGVAAALFGAVTGVLGYKIGQTPPAPIVIQLMQPPAAHP